MADTLYDDNDENDEDEDVDDVEVNVNVNVNVNEMNYNNLQHATNYIKSKVDVKEACTDHLDIHCKN